MHVATAITIIVYNLSRYCPRPNRVEKSNRIPLYLHELIEFDTICFKVSVLVLKPFIIQIKFNSIFKVYDT